MADILTIQRPEPRMVGAKEVASYLSVSPTFVRHNRKTIPGFLCVTAAGRRGVYRWDMNKVEAWQREQQSQRNQQRTA